MNTKLLCIIYSVRRRFIQENQLEKDSHIAKNKNRKEDLRVCARKSFLIDRDRTERYDSHRNQ